MSEGNGYATRDSMFARPFARRYDEHYQQWAGETAKFRYQNLNDAEKGVLDSEAVNSKGKFRRQSVETADARLIVAALVDGAGNRTLGNGDVPTIQSYDSAEVAELAAAIRKHCGWEEEPEKNSGTTADAASPTS